MGSRQEVPLKSLLKTFTVLAQNLFADFVVVVAIPGPVT